MTSLELENSVRVKTMSIYFSLDPRAIKYLAQSGYFITIFGRKKGRERKKRERGMDVTPADVKFKDRRMETRHPGATECGQDFSYEAAFLC